MGKHKTSVRADVALPKTEKYDIIKILLTERYDSKPNMGKFLKQYVQSIRLSINNGKVEMWPKIDYDVSKAFVKFNDGHELIKDYYAPATYPKFYVFDGIDEIRTDEKIEKTVEKFFSYLEGFKFIRANQQSIEQMFTKDGVERLNEKLDVENKIIESHLLSGDFTPAISCSKLT